MTDESMIARRLVESLKNKPDYVYLQSMTLVGMTEEELLEKHGINWTQLRESLVENESVFRRLFAVPYKIEFDAVQLALRVIIGD